MWHGTASCVAPTIAPDHEDLSCGARAVGSGWRTSARTGPRVGPDQEASVRSVLPSRLGRADLPCVTAVLLDLELPAFGGSSQNGPEFARLFKKDEFLDQRFPFGLDANRIETRSQSAPELWAEFDIVLPFVQPLNRGSNDRASRQAQKPDPCLRWPTRRKLKPRKPARGIRERATQCQKLWLSVNLSGRGAVSCPNLNCG